MSGLGLGQLAAHGFAKLTGTQRMAGATQPLAATASNTVVLPSGDQLTKAHVGLPSADNTSDANKPVSTAQQTALDFKLNAANPSYTGTLTGGTGVVNLGSGQFVKDASGNVGVGTNTPTSLSNRKVISAVDSWGGVFESSDSASKWARFGIDNFNTGLGCRIESSGGIVLLPVPDTIGATLDASGNLGLGVAPSAWGGGLTAFQFGSTGSMSANTNLNYVDYRNNSYRDGTGVSRYQIDGAASMLQMQTDGSFRWLTAPSGTAGNPISFTQAMTLDASGNLLVGTTSARGVGATIYNPGSGVGRIDINKSLSGAATGFGFYYNGADVGSISYDNTSTSFNTSSDARLKENIAAADNGSALIDGLQVRKFDWKADGSHQRFGFVAQELDAVYPEAVSKPADPDEMMGVDYSKLVPLLVQEIQSLRARVAALETV